jgi:hypothetical protein
MKTSTLAAALLVSLPMAAFAQQQPQLPAFEFRLGAFWPSIDTTVQANASNGAIGSTINMESDLGLQSSKTLPIFDASWRFAPRHRLEFNYVSLDRSATATASGEIRFGDTVFPVSTNVVSKFDSTVYALTYLYSLYQDSNNEVAVGIGVDYTDLTVGISSSLGSLSASKGAKAPLPVLALTGTTRWTNEWTAKAGVQWFGIKYGDYDGTLDVFNAAVQYYPVKNWGVEGGYSYYKYRLNVNKSDWDGNANYKFSGPTLSLVGRF